MPLRIAPSLATLLRSVCSNILSRPCGCSRSRRSCRCQKPPSCTQGPTGIGTCAGSHPRSRLSFAGTPHWPRPMRSGSTTELTQHRSFFTPAPAHCGSLANRVCCSLTCRRTLRHPSSWIRASPHCLGRRRSGSAAGGTATWQSLRPRKRCAPCSPPCPHCWPWTPTACSSPHLRTAANSIASHASLPQSSASQRTR